MDTIIYYYKDRYGFYWWFEKGVQVEHETGQTIFNYARNTIISELRKEELSTGKAINKIVLRRAK